MAHTLRERKHVCTGTTEIAPFLHTVTYPTDGTHLSALQCSSRTKANAYASESLRLPSWSVNRVTGKRSFGNSVTLPRRPQLLPFNTTVRRHLLNPPPVFRTQHSQHFFLGSQSFWPLVDRLMVCCWVPAPGTRRKFRRFEDTYCLHIHDN